MNGEGGGSGPVFPLPPLASEQVRDFHLIASELERRGYNLRDVFRNLGLGLGSSGVGFKKYQQDPIAFAHDVLGVRLWSRQAEVLQAVSEHRNVSVRSGHSVGKTKLAAVTFLWFLYCFENSICLSTAPTARQVEEQLWREIRSMFKSCRANGKLPLGRCLNTRLEIDEKWFGLGLSTDDPDRFQGYHAENLLVVVDEASGVDESIFQAIEAVTTSRNNKKLLLGNPTVLSGTFHASHHLQRDRWRPLHISCYDSPNLTGERVGEEVSSALVTAEWPEEKREEWGEESPLFQSRVLGNFPHQAEDSLISLAWVEAAGARGAFSFSPLSDDRGQVAATGKGVGGVGRAPTGRIMGVDVARHGACESVATIVEDGHVLHMEAWRVPDTMQTAGRCVRLAREFNVSLVRVDATGMGVGVHDAIKEAGVNSEAVFVGAAPQDTKQFSLLKDEIWWDVREQLRLGQVSGLTDELCKMQLISIKYRFTRRGQIQVETKEELMKRGIASPDRADSLCLALARMKSRSRKVVAW